MPNSSIGCTDSKPLGILGTAFPIRFTKEQAICYLGLTVENGKKAILENFFKSGILLYEAAYTDFINRLITSVTEYNLLNDPDFAVSLQLAWIHLVSKNPDWPPVLEDHLKEIFPAELTQKLLLKVLRWRKEEINRIRQEGEKAKIQLGKEFEARLKAHYDHYKRVIDAALNPNHPPLYSTMPIQRGTPTQIPCPNCGLKKRCDANTKRFRCKNCGFDKAYPLS